jgi:hypothetical protein
MASRQNRPEKWTRSAEAGLFKLAAFIDTVDKSWTRCGALALSAIVVATIHL